ncbi:MAG TPA: hypothetical protein VMU41_09490 [Candidatus Binataceae bacterium]|nr:hypothetical protein [Candidatus Binataceae bacterium]
MKLTNLSSLVHRTRHINLRHSFAIGPLCDSYLFNGRARLYYCTRCRWNFLVSNNAIAVIDDEGRPLVGEKAKAQFRSFENGPCPVLQGLALETGSILTVPSLVNSKGSGNDSDNHHENESLQATPRTPSRWWLRSPAWQRKDFRWQA